MADDQVQVLKVIDTKLGAILTMLADENLRDAAGHHYRARSLDRMLTDAGMTGVEVGRVLGKSPQAVSQALAREKGTKTMKKPRGTDDGE